MRPFALTVLLALAVACTTIAPPPEPVAEKAPAPAIAAPAPAAPAPAASASAVATADKPTPAAAPLPRIETATFAVPSLDALVATNMAAALAAVKGVTAARPRIADQRFEVDFAPPVATPDGLLAALKAVSPATTLEGVKPANGAPAPEGGCGACPMKDSCGGHAPVPQ